MTGANLSILIADDESLARKRLAALCARITVAGELFMADCGEDALYQLETNPVDVVLLDINMPDLSGLAIAHHCQAMEHVPDVIFTTAHRKYAIDAFRLDATDYLLKPVKETLLREALARVAKKLARRAAGLNDFSYDRLWVKDGDSCVQIRTIDIDIIAAERDYMRLCLAGRSFLIHQSMASLEKKLPTGLFVRVHRSTMVRRDLIAEIRRRGRRHFIILTDDREIAIGPLFLDALTNGQI